MAYVHPSPTSRDVLGTLQRNTTRAVAVVAYGTAFVVAVLMLSPILFKGSGVAAPIPAGPAPILYTVQAGDTPGTIAAAHGLSLAELYSLNPSLTPFTTAKGARIVVGLH
jgi:LysM repeat protein